MRLSQLISTFPSFTAPFKDSNYVHDRHRGDLKQVECSAKRKKPLSSASLADWSSAIEVEQSDLVCRRIDQKISRRYILMYNT
jgi:hypothetical protein